MGMDARRFGQRVLLSRRDIGKKQEAVAREAGISAGYLSAIENGTASNPSVQIVEDLAVALGVSVQYLLGLSENPLPEEESYTVAAQERNGYNATAVQDMPPYGPEVLDMMRDAPDLVRQQIHEVVRVIHEASIIERDLLELVAWFQSEMPPELIAEIGQGMRLRFRTGDRQAALDYAKARLTAFFDAEPKIAAEAD